MDFDEKEKTTNCINQFLIDPAPSSQWQINEMNEQCGNTANDFH